MEGGVRGTTADSRCFAARRGVQRSSGGYLCTLVHFVLDQRWKRNGVMRGVPRGVTRFLLYLPYGTYI